MNLRAPEGKVGAQWIALMVSMILLAASSSTGSTAGISPRPTELSALDFEGEWRTTSDPSFPKVAIKAFPKDDKYDLAQGPLNFLFVDLDWDGKAEIIVAGRGRSGSGGTGYFLLQNTGKTWRFIGEFQGGFVLSVLDNPSRFYRITSYYRSGDTYQNTYDYRNGSYRLTTQVLIPRIVSYSCWWHPFWARLNSFPVHVGGSPNCDNNEHLLPRQR